MAQGSLQTHPITESKARKLRQDAAEILAAELLQTKEHNKRKWNDRDAGIKAAKRRSQNLRLDNTAT